jgi:KaiC/GvpD/RAD55 family RecA-like ATPase
MLVRMILPEWALKENIGPKVIEGDYTDAEIYSFNSRGYNVYYYPNPPRDYKPGSYVDGRDISDFTWVFTDFDLKDNQYPDKDSFIAKLGEGPEPTKIVDSGNGVHAYWKVIGLDAMSYLRLTRRLMRFYKTDEAVGKILQLMRLPATMNTKIRDNVVTSVGLYSSDAQYTPEELDRFLPPITQEDEEFCQNHYNRTYNKTEADLSIVNKEMPAKFGWLIKNNQEAKSLWASSSDDRSRDDYRLGHIMFANGFTRDEARVVLMNTAKASQRAPAHRYNYSDNIVNKIWVFEETGDDTLLSSSVRDILQRPNSILKGTPFRCHPRIDNTAHGFRLGQVIGLVGGSGIGKTTFGLNMFRWFIQENPDYHHFFVPLEQPSNEIADRWNTMCGGDTSLNSKVHVISNFDNNGNFRNLSLTEIQDYITKWKETTGNKVGCVVIDHIGALKKKGTDNENQDLMSICHAMKAFAVQTDTMLVMQSQTNRQKAGIGDLELDKDAAYGTTTFEWYCDYLITIWQPLKRCHAEEACPTVTAFKFCKIRHKKAKQDVIKEDVPYYMYFDSEKEQLRDMTQDEETSFKYFLPKATNKRKLDKKTEVLEYQSVPYAKA